MPQSLDHVLIHVIFSTKKRQTFLKDPLIRQDLWAYMANTLRNHNCHFVKVGGYCDHIHILTTLPRTITIADLVYNVKKPSAMMMQKQGGLLTNFHWQTGYSVFSVSESLSETVANYIENQEQHHSHSSFQDEYRQLLIKHNKKFDEKYVWE